MAVTVHVAQVDKSQTPYKLDPDQTLRASKALLSHAQAEAKRLAESRTKPNLLANDESDQDDLNEGAEPIWLNLSTKQHIADKVKLKPSKIQVPHSLNQSENLTICLITTDPQRAVKNAVADSTFPTSLSTRITRIIGYTKLVARYKSFEQRRQLLSEHDIFLVDERVAPRLPKTLGKIFYKGTAKRPIPINLSPRDRKETQKAGAKNKKPSKEEREANVAAPTIVAKEIEKALTCVPVSISPGRNIAVRIGHASFTPQQIADNVLAVTNGVIEKHVASGWKNVQGIHIKTPTSFAVPIWLAEDLWSGEDKIMEDADAGDNKAEESSLATTTEKKRKRAEPVSHTSQADEKKKAKIAEAKSVEKDETAKRKKKLATQKAQAFKADI